MSRRFTPWALAAALVFLFGGATSAGLVDATFHGHMSVDGVPYELPVYLDPVNGYGIIDWTIETDEYICQLYVSMNPDPEIVYSVTVTDFGAPSVFSFSFGETIVPTGSLNTVAASIGGGLLDNSGDGVRIVPALADVDGDLLPEVAIAYVGSPTTNMGVDVGLDSLPLIGLGPGAEYGWGDYSDFRIPGPTAPPGGWTELNVDLVFGLSGGRDIAAITGRASINEVIPEPSSFLLAGLGLVGLGAFRFRRRSR